MPPRSSNIHFSAPAPGTFAPARRAERSATATTELGIIKARDLREVSVMVGPARQEWDQVGDRFSALGQAVVRRYRVPDVGSDQPGGEGEDRVAVGEAFDQLVASVRHLAERATDVLRDATVKAQAKEVARSLNAALSATVDDLGEEVDALLKRAKARKLPKSESSGPDESSAPPS